MHPGPPLQTYKGPPPIQDDGAEEEHTLNKVEVTSSCTAVCEIGHWGRSCSLTGVYPKGRTKQLTLM